MSVVEKHRAAGPTKLKFAVIIASNRLYEAKLRGRPVEDVSGDVASAIISKAGHEIVKRCLIPNDPFKMIKEVVDAVEGGADVVVISGGTGLGPRDLTVESVTPLFEKRIPGFGELFRKLSFKVVGPAAMLSRADAGVYRSSAVFLLPGSPDAVELALTKLILPEAGHLLAEVRGLR
ncbi:MAG: molybdenum cofactor biosynthesis protein MoaB [Candidatus Nezhaarchaeota archaeon]|nr:molybdenum cofactor biosynthesis protein MoaB [Candidatus Nezhaarchaeota archaeon]